MKIGTHASFIIFLNYRMRSKYKAKENTFNEIDLTSVQFAAVHPSQYLAVGAGRGLGRVG